jgi:hypothetical protein
VPNLYWVHGGSVGRFSVTVRSPGDGLCTPYQRRLATDAGPRSSALAARRARIVEAFLDGTLARDDRDARLAAVDAEIAKAKAALGAVRPAAAFDAEELAAVFEPFRDWDLLTRLEKRRLLASLAPEFDIADYEIRGLRLLGVSANILKDSRSKTAPSVSRALPCLSPSPPASCWRRL